MANTRKLFIKGLVAMLGTVILIGFTSCETSKKDPKPADVKPMVFETGPVDFLQLGGVIESFHILIEDLGNKPIEEYGIVYMFDSKEITTDPVITDKKAIFEEPAKVGKNSKTVKIGYPVGTTCMVCRAYAKFKDGTVQYAESKKMLF